MNKDVGLYYGVYDWDTIFNSVVPESTDYICVHFCVGTLTSNRKKIRFITKMVQLCRKRCMFTAVLALADLSTLCVIANAKFALYSTL